ncbi:MAG: ribosome biogenesis GTP-binding protein YihA/YsxC [Bacteroidales bacterium]
MSKDKVKQIEFVKSSEKIEQCPAPDRHEYAFIGRSNVGKSSLINALSNRRNIAKISSTPGKTRLINHFVVNNAWYLVDLPGYGYAKRSKSERKLFDKIITDYLSERPNLVAMFVLIDSRIPPQKADIEFINRLGEMQVPFYLVFTKADKLSATQQSKLKDNMFDVLKDSWEALPAHFVTSAKTKEGCQQVLSEIHRLNNEIPVNKFL